MEYISRVGSGSFGVAELVFDNERSEFSVFKIIDEKLDIRNEVLNHNYVSDHENIIKLKSFGSVMNYNYIELEYAENGDLFHFIKNSGKQTESYTKFFISNLLNGIEYCHNKGIVHWDIKLENILLDKNNKPKLADFGYSTYLTKHKNKVGTLQYMAPEILIGNIQDIYKVDIYALGVCMYVILHNTYPFKGTNNIEIGTNILRNKYKINNNLSIACIDLLNQILEPDQKNRITIQEIREHPWLKN